MRRLTLLLAIGLVAGGVTAEETVTETPVSYTHLRAHETRSVIAYAVFCL